MNYKFLDYTGLAHVIETIKNQFVQKVAGKDLSTNDFTDANKTKLNGIETGAQVNIVNKVNDKTGDIILNSDDISFTSSKSGSTPTTTRAIIDSILDKDIAQDAANAQVTNRVSNLETVKADKSYTDTELGKKADKTTTYTKTEVDGKLSSLDTGVISVNEKTGTVILNADDIDDTETNNKFVSAAEKTTWNGKANVSYVDTEVEKKADKTTVYTKTEVDTELNKKADKTTTYTKTEVDTELNKKADKTTTYTKTEVDGKLSSLDTGVISVNEKTGTVILNADDIDDTETISKFVSAAEKSTWSGKQDKLTTGDNISIVNNKISATDTTYSAATQTVQGLMSAVDKKKLDGVAAGAQVNTVNSVNTKTGNVVLSADDINDGATNNKFVSATEKTTWNGKANVSYVDTEVGKKVDKVTGKGLSTNDFTTTLKDKLDGIDSGAQTNVIEIIKRNGTNLTVTGKAVDISVPTKLSDLTNDRTFQTEAQIKSLISEHGKLKKEIVTELPTLAAADENTMYLTRNEQNTGYEEWMVINGTWEILGDTAAVDFTGYIHEDDISLITTTEIDTMFAAV